MGSLGEISFFSPLDASLREALEERLVPREYAAGEVLFEQGDPGLGLFVVFDGELAVLGPGDTVLARLGPGEVVGEMAILDGGARSATVRATETTRCGLLTRGDVLPLLRSEPELALEMVGLIARRVRAGRAVGERPRETARDDERDGREPVATSLLAGALLAESFLAAGRKTLQAWRDAVRDGEDPEKALRDALEVLLLESARTPARVAHAILDDDREGSCDETSD